MRRLTVLVATVLAAAALFAFAMPAIAGAAYATNAECLACHDQATGTGAITRVDFNVGTDTSVDYAKCKACHWIGPTTYIRTRFGHNHVIGSVDRLGNRTGGPTCQSALCHTAKKAPGAGDLSRIMTTSTPDGWFATATSSRDATSGQMHAIHVNGSWPKDATFISPCKSCHAAAACDMCHVSPPAAHGDHTWSDVTGVYANPPVTYPVAGGSAIDQTPTVNTVTLDTVTCANSACHSLSAAGTAGFTPFCGSCHPGNLGVHGYDSIDHTATAVSEPGSGGIKCDACHAMDLMTEHEKTGGTCLTCHSSSADPGPRDAFGTWNKGCDQCHGVGTTPAKHTGAATAHKGDASATCAAGSGCHDVSDVTVLHAGAEFTQTGGTTLKSCQVCHVPGGPAPTSVACGSCHIEDGVDYHTHTDAVHTGFASASTTCVDSGCHETRLLADVHQPFVGTGKSYTTTCELCHRNADPTRINWATATAQCGSCHGTNQLLYHDYKHTGTSASSVECLSCHGPDNRVEPIHGAYYLTSGTTEKCATCHNQPNGVGDITYQYTSSECGNCHAYSPVASAHPVATGTHDATEASCAKCHQAALVAEHGSLTCAGCHTSAKFGALTSPWNKSCTVCHATKHADQTGLHTSAQTSCGGPNCHPSLNLETLHSKATTTVAGITYNGCDVCHRSAADQPTSSACDSCHAGHGDISAKHTATAASASCIQCHKSSDVLVLHAGNTTFGPCAVCHDNTARVPSLPADVDCSRCHAYSPVASAHPVATGTHDATEASCAKCHQAALVAEHGSLTCAGCHTSAKFGALTSPWNKSCTVCHATKHADQTGLHTSAQTSCGGPNCHPSVNLETLHSKATTTVAGTTYNGCDVCHRSAADQPTSSACDSCHAGHGDISAKHTATAASASCIQCHKSSDVLVLHAGNTTFGPCAVCHDNTARVPSLPADVDCSRCHAYSPVASAHPVATGTHDATEASCAKCHGTALVAEHGSLTCAGCHTSAKFGALTSPWNKSCTVCHATKHADQTGLHTSAQTSCGGPNCHPSLNLETLHSKATTTVAGITYNGCDVCHRSAADQPTSSACDSCHAGHGDISAKHTATAASASCIQCHKSSDVLVLHAGNTTFGPCAVCHDNTARVPSLPADVDCSRCHAYSPVASAHPVATGTHDATEASCAKCHGTALVAEHGSLTCAGCHTSAKFGALTSPWNKSCTVCHATKHADQTGLHTSAQTSCGGPNCHPSLNLETLHSKATTTVAGITYNGCDVCHRSAADQPTSSACDSCHAGHGDISAKHTATAASASCIQCHKSSDVLVLHAGNTTFGPCAVCHDNTARVPSLPADVDCSRCHAYSPVASAHPVATGTHDATEASCAKCHQAALVAEHGSLTCAGCHTSAKFGALTSPWNKSCTVCHATKHADQTGLHTSAQTSCGGPNCHPSVNLETLHSKATTTVAGTTYNGCDVCHRSAADQPTSSACDSCHAGHGDISAKHTATAASASCIQCHKSSDVLVLHAGNTTFGPCAVCHDNTARVPSLPADVDCSRCHDGKHLGAALAHTSANTSCTGAGCHDVTKVDVLHAPSVSGCAACHKAGAVMTTDCAASGCHADLGTSHHALHDASGVIDVGCKGCHETSLDTEHALLGKTCGTCHESTNASVVAAIKNHQRACSACHPAVLNGQNTHSKLNTEQFIRANQSGHRAYASLPAQRTTFFINGATRTWPLPADSAYLKSGWTSTSVVSCDKCHTFASTAAGPHGAAVAVNMDPAYPTDWKTVYIGSSGSHTSSTSGASSDTFICAKCHTGFDSMNGTHSDSNHNGSRDGRCIGCHTKIPHSWRLPRLLAYTNDPAPYASLNLTGLAVKDYTSNRWSRDDCTVSGCSEHGGSMSNRWPSTVIAYGTITGRVTDALGVAVAAATVTNDRAQSTATDVNGVYTFTSVPSGITSVTVTVVKAGLITQAKPVAFADGETVTLDFQMAKLGSIAGVVSEGTSPLAGVTVSITGSSFVTLADGKFSFAGKAAGSYTVTFTKAGYTTQTKSVTVANDIVADASITLVPLPNLALNKAFTASRSQGTSYAPANAGDGNLTTYWWSNSAGGAATTEWLTVDLGTSQSVSKVQVMWFDGYWARSFRVYASTNGTTWTQVYSTTSGTGATGLISFTSRNARYIKLECRGTATSSTNTGYGVAELRVFQ